MVRSESKVGQLSRLSIREVPKVQQDSQPAPDELREKLGEFFHHNPDAEYRKNEHASSISHPWGDDSLEIILHTNQESLMSALNSVYLPPSFTAILHLATGDLEVIYAPVHAETD